jgi:hypothetical protein
MPDEPPPTFGLPDRGELLESMARSMADESVTAAVKDELAKVRRPDRSLVLEDLQPYRTSKDGPLYTLSMILSLDVFRVGAWVQDGFGGPQRRQAVRTVEDLCRREGIDAAVAWAVAHAEPDRLHVTTLREQMEEFAHSDQADMIRRILQKSLRRWR